jgi:type III secretion protein S
MTYDQIIQLTMQGLGLVLLISLPITAVAALTGLLVSLVQAITSLQDQSVAQGLKLMIVTLVIFFIAPWAGALVLGYARQAILGAAG